MTDGGVWIILLMCWGSKELFGLPGRLIGIFSVHVDARLQISTFMPIMS